MDVERTADWIRAAGADVLPGPERARLATMLADDVGARLLQANGPEDQAWAAVKTRADWEAFRDPRLDALRRSLGPTPDPAPLEVMVTRTIDGQGFRIENLVFQSRPGLVVTANLYLPDPPRPAMPGIVIVHSHHNPKTQVELQDMGMNWARQGAMVLVMDQIGHGERRQQPFGGREDYHFRYITGMQLDLAGESLMGWMVWDLGRGIDLLLDRPGIDRERIIIVGAVAGGGDPAAVVCALDGRVTCSVPFNFGAGERARGAGFGLRVPGVGLEEPDSGFSAPGTRHPAPTLWNLAASGSWETTRNLRLSARDGFFPWVIVAAAAPRHLIYAHEFEWDAEADPVWPRLQRVFDFYGAGDRLAATKGWGHVRLRPPEASHCNNVGVPHRQGLYPVFERWFGMTPPDPEYQERREPGDLACLTPEAAARFQTRRVHELAAETADERLAAARRRRASLAPAERADRLRRDLADVLGRIEPAGDPEVAALSSEEADGVVLERVVLQVEPGIVVPLLLLRPTEASGPMPVVVGVAHPGKERFLRHRAEAIAGLLANGVAVCLPDVRGTGETDFEGGHAWQVEWNTQALWVSSSELMLGQTLLGSRLRDVRSVLRYLRARLDVDEGRVAVWGESFAPVNPDGLEDPPLKTETPPHLAEPLGAHVALLTALFDEDIPAVVARGGLVGYRAILASPFCYVPHDVIVPGILAVGDVADMAAALAPRPLRLERSVDGRNLAVTPEAVETWFEPVRAAYADRPDQLVLAGQEGGDLASWLIAALR